MNEALKNWLDKELEDYEPVWKSFKNKQQKVYFLCMAGTVIGMVALGFFVGYDWKYVLRVHFLIGLAFAAFIWLCVLLTNKAGSMKKVRKTFEKSLSALPPADQALLAEQDFGRADFLNPFDNNMPVRLLVGKDYWIYFRNPCCIYKVADMEKLSAKEDKTRINYNVGNARVHQKVAVGVSLMVDYRKESNASKEFDDEIFLAGWKQFNEAKELISQHCPAVSGLWEE